ncbi:MAG: hypothetical protein ACXW0L_04250 [Methylosarcina sp.]
MKFRNLKPWPLAALMMLTACTTIPAGPGVLVLPGTGKSFDQFRQEDSYCRQYASWQTGGTTPSKASAASGVGSAIAGTALGAAAGAAFGGGEGAAIGAGSGLLAGSLVGTGAGGSAGYEAQERYDMSYIQCMYAYGNRVPISGNFIEENRERQKDRIEPYSPSSQPPSSYPSPAR